MMIGSTNLHFSIFDHDVITCFDVTTENIHQNSSSGYAKTPT